jgi:hypothetical protein
VDGAVALSDCAQSARPTRSTYDPRRRLLNRAMGSRARRDDLWATPRSPRDGSMQQCPHTRIHPTPLQIQRARNHQPRSRSGSLQAPRSRHVDATIPPPSDVRWHCCVGRSGGAVPRVDGRRWVRSLRRVHRKLPPHVDVRGALQRRARSDPVADSGRKHDRGSPSTPSDPSADRASVAGSP